MKYKAIIMTPQVVEFDSEGSTAEVTNIGWSKCNNFEAFILVDEDLEFQPRLAAIFPVIPPETEKILVFDPPPYAA